MKSNLILSSLAFLACLTWQPCLAIPTEQDNKSSPLTEREAHHPDITGKIPPAPFLMRRPTSPEEMRNTMKDWRQGEYGSVRHPSHRQELREDWHPEATFVRQPLTPEQMRNQWHDLRQNPGGSIHPFTPEQMRNLKQ